MLTRRDFHRLFLAASGAAAMSGTVLRAASAQTAARVTAIDCHAHIFEKGLTLAGERRYAPDYDATVKDYLANLDAHGNSHGVLVQPSFLGTDNSYLAAALRRFPARLRGIAVVEPTASPSQLAELSEAGVVGIRLNLVGKPDPELGTAPWKQLLRALADLDWQVEVQAEAKRLAGLVDPLVQSGVKLVIDHFGRPDPKLGIEDPGFRYLLSRGETRRVWVKLSGAYRIGGEANAAAAAPLLKDAFGPDRLVWGSDWPHTQFEKVTNYTTTRAQLDAWLPNAEDRRIVLADTPSQLFRFTGT